MKKLVCGIVLLCFCLLCSCGTETEKDSGLSVITARPDMCIAFGNENGCYRLTMDRENNVGLNYIDFADCKEKQITPVIDIAPTASANIFMADGNPYLLTVDLHADSPASTLSVLDDAGNVTAQIAFPENNTINSMLAQDDDCIYTMLADTGIKRSNLIRINKSDMVYEILMDYSISARLLTVYENRLILQDGGRIISYDTKTKQQTVLLETDKKWYGCGRTLLADRGSQSVTDTFDIPSAVQWERHILSSGMLADFLVCDDTVIPGYLVLRTVSEITGDAVLHFMDRQTLQVNKSISMKQFTLQQPYACCGDKIIVVEADYSSVPFEYNYKISLLADYLDGTGQFTDIEMLE